MDKYIYYIWLNSMNFSADFTARLVEHFGSAKAVYEAEKEELLNCELVLEKHIEKLSDKSLKRVQAEYKKAEKLGISFVCIEDEIYPKSLLNIFDPPILLYAKGDLSLLEKELCFCIVGSRTCTPYGLTAAMQVSSQLAECGMVIVSGLAIVIDSAAHQGAMKGGKTIGVAACGLGVNYPAGNGAVRRKIMQEGLIISEFPLDYIAYQQNFHRRNRILSGLSLGVAVIEAGIKSGALITARHAREQNRDVFALPGNISSIESAGSNILISEGVTPLLGAETVLAEYLPRYTHLFEIDDYMEEYKAKQREKEEKIEPSEIKEALEEKNDDSEAMVLKLLKNGEMNFEKLAYETGFETSRLNVLLTTMQINGLILEKPGRNFVLR